MTDGTYSGDVQSELGIDPDTASWKEYAACKGLDTDFFYDYYEGDPFMAKTIDQTCLSCPVMVQCLEWGVENGEWGVWGGVYLTSGKKDTNKNAHKTKEVWDAIAQRISE